MLSRLTCTILFFAVLLIILLSMLVLFMVPGSDESDSDSNKMEQTSSSTYTSASKCFPVSLGKNKLATRKSLFGITKEVIERNAYTLTGDSMSDNENLKAIEKQSCEGLVPVVVIKMSPNDGQLQLGESMKKTLFYQPKSKFASWKEYDKALKKYLKKLSQIPSVVILEPNLLMATYEADFLQYRWSNQMYEENFLQRALKVSRELKQSWVYLDAGNAYYLESNVKNIDQMASTLLRVPGIKGFVLNAYHFFNTTYNEHVAKKLSCRTGLNYILDTSRNGGVFSKQNEEKIQNCMFDPPTMKKGVLPGWGWGIASAWQRPDVYSLRSSQETTSLVQVRKRSLRRCYSEAKGYELKDATVWLKCPGESDGRLFQYGVFRKCLIGHQVECDSMCPLINHQGVANLNPGCSCNFNSIYS